MSSSKVSLRTEKTRSGGIELGELARTARSRSGECVDALALLVLAPPIAKVEDIDQAIDQDLVGIWSIFKIKI